MERFDFENIAGQCVKQVRNKLYFKYRALSPAIFRMPVVFLPAGTGRFGTDAEKIYADPMSVIIAFKNSPEKLERMYVHMIFHCIYLHPFAKEGKDEGLWGIALDICCETAVLRLDPKDFDGKDAQRQQIISQIKAKVPMMLPETVYKELESGSYDIPSLVALFHLDDHLWMEKGEGNKRSSQNGGQRNSQDKESSQDSGQGSDNQNENGKRNGQNSKGSQSNEDSQENSPDGGSSNGNQDDENGPKKQPQNDSQGRGDTPGDTPGNQQAKAETPENPYGGSISFEDPKMRERQQEWNDVSRRIAEDMQSFGRHGKDPEETAKEIGYMAKDKMEYTEFLSQFAVPEEQMKIDMDEFDYMYYMYGMSLPGKKKRLLIEPLEYKEGKTIRDFVIAIDTSGSCAGELVQRFLKKTYSILKDTESFSSRVNVHIIQCDARVQDDTKIESLEALEGYMEHMTLHGFGGTDFRPVFEYVDQMIRDKEFENLSGLIYFTDGYGVYPKKPTPYRTAFAFVEDYRERENIPPWAMSVFWKDE